MWEQYNNYPSYGFGIHYADLIADREDTIVGNPFSAFVFYSAPRIKVGQIRPQHRPFPGIKLYLPVSTIR